MGEMRKVGSLEVSVAGLGCNNFGMRMDAEQTKAVVDAALDAGVNSFDTAEVYGGGHSEEFLGAALGARRGEAVITTKFGAGRGVDPPGRGAEANINRAVEVSLGRLGTDYIDLYLLHTPDPSTPIVDTLAALNALIDAGKVREIGCRISPPMSTRRRRRPGERPAPLRERAEQHGSSTAGSRTTPCPRSGSSKLTSCPPSHAAGVLPARVQAQRAAPEGARLSVGTAQGSPGDARFGVVEALGACGRTTGTRSPSCPSWLTGCPVVGSVIASDPPEQVPRTVATSVGDDRRAQGSATSRRGRGRPGPDDLGRCSGSSRARSPTSRPARRARVGAGRVLVAARAGAARRRRDGAGADSRGHNAARPARPPCARDVPGAHDRDLHGPAIAPARAHCADVRARPSASLRFRRSAG